ncbi:MAG: hypothetical protein AAGA58_19595 [Verrucomicrobiota bacterium]
MPIHQKIIEFPQELTVKRYDREVIDAVWRFAAKITGNDPELWRKDEFGAWIYRLDYGNRRSQFGWEISETGSGQAISPLLALRPLQWQNATDVVQATRESRVTADGLQNVRELL